MAGKALLKQGVRRRQKILAFIRSYHAKHGYSPTIQEIAEGVGLVSPNATRNHLHRLAEQGFITITPSIARGIALADPQPLSRAV